MWSPILKKRATVDEQIASLHRRGITFHFMDEDAAREFLTNKSYFYKLKSYRNNYPKIPSGKTVDDYRYEDLDFGYLVELSNIDFALSRLVLSLALGVEHAVKVRTNKLFMAVQDPEIADTCVRRVLHGETPEIHPNPYTDGLVEHCAGEHAAWHLWELQSFNSQVELYKAYHSVRGTSERYVHMLYIVRKLRNAVSHGSCLLADVTRLAPTKKREGRSDTQVTNAGLQLCGRNPKKSGKRNSALTQTLDRLVVNNYAAVLACHLEFVDSSKVLTYSAASVEDFVKRIEKRREKYFGRENAPKERNRDVNTTLEALVHLSKGYVTKACEKANRLEQQRQSMPNGTLPNA